MKKIDLFIPGEKRDKGAAMKIFITGASGFIGSHLTARLLEDGHEVAAVGRSAAASRGAPPRYRYFRADPTDPGDWQAAVSEADIIINLAGKSIFGRWTKRIKQEIYDSRVLTTRNVVEALADSNDALLCSASGIGYYGNRGEALLTESEPAGADFLAGLGADWEKEAMRAADKGTRVMVMRFGVILSRAGGALEKMIRQFRSFVGGPVGNGRQWVSWMHLQDLIAAVQFAIATPAIRGPVNFCAPEPVRNRELARALARRLGRPAVVPTPAFMLKAVLGEFGNVLLDSQRATPQQLLQSGFRFKYPQLEDALGEILSAGSV
jgi:uncharacterized protein (TIGR01777 family)